MRISKEQYNTLCEFAFSDLNHGYKPNVIESANSDGEIWDNDKIYAHIAPKYLYKIKDLYKIKNINKVLSIYNECRDEAFRICKRIGIPKDFLPGNDSTLRVIKYPPGAVTNKHTDISMMTISMYRNSESEFKYLKGHDDYLLNKARKISPGIHMGRLMKEILGTEPTEHEVTASKSWQYSAVFFVIPNHDAVLPSGLTVGKWLEIKKLKSRKEK